MFMYGVEASSKIPVTQHGSFNLDNVNEHLVSKDIYEHLTKYKKNSQPKVCMVEEDPQGLGVVSAILGLDAKPIGGR